MKIHAIGVAALVGLAGCRTEYSETPGMPPSPCAPSFEPTMGELGVLGFAHDRGAFVCAFGCGAAEALAEGSVSRLAVYSDADVPAVSVASDDPSVAEFAIGDGGIDVTSHAPGTARLEVRDESGALVDALSVVVKPVTSIETRTDLTVMVGGSAHVGVELKDELGCPMLGIGGVEYTLGGGIDEAQVTLADAIASFLFGQFESSADESFAIEAVALGEGEIAIVAESGASVKVPVSVVDETSVAAVELSTPEQPLAVGSSHPVSARATTEDGRQIESPVCAWELAGMSGSAELVDEGRDTAYVMSDGPAKATIECSIGAVSGTLALAFE